MATHFWVAIVNGVRRCPTLPQGPPCSTIGAESLSFRVRNVTGRFPLAMAAVTLATHAPEGTWSNLGHTSCVCSLVRPDVSGAVCRSCLCEHDPRYGARILGTTKWTQAISDTPTSLYNGMSVVIIKLSAY